MKKSHLVLFMLIVSAWIYQGCSKEATPSEDLEITVFKNPTSNPDANALQGMVENKKDNYKVYLYGTFDSDNNPLKLHTIVYHKIGNDTTVNFTIDTLTQKLKTASISVNGVKQPYIIEHNFIEDNDSAVEISVYSYNWETNTGELVFSAIYENVDGTIQQNVTYTGFRTDGVQDWGDVAAVAASFIIAEAAFYGTGVGIFSTAVGTALVGAVGTVTVVAIGAAAVIGVLALINEANAGELIPQNTTPPGVTEIQNPVLPNQIVLPTKPCGTGLEPCYSLIGTWVCTSWSGTVKGCDGNYVIVNKLYNQSQDCKPDTCRAVVPPVAYYVSRENRVDTFNIYIYNEINPWSSVYIKKFNAIRNLRGNTVDCSRPPDIENTSSEFHNDYVVGQSINLFGLGHHSFEWLSPNSIKFTIKVDWGPVYIDDVIIFNKQ